MGIDIHAFNFIKRQAACASLGKVLTIGRQSLSLDLQLVDKDLARKIEKDTYCENLLLALNASSVESIDFSDYENASYVADLNGPVNLGIGFDTIIDSGSLEHIFDVAAAFRNLIKMCKVGGRIIHFLPVNNLNGHGFWQFSSDLVYTVYGINNGFVETEVYYASSLDSSTWYKMPEAKPGARIEIVSIEPIILLSVTRKERDVDFISVTQPFYAKAWSEKDASIIQSNHGQHFYIKTKLKKYFLRRGWSVNLIRNFNLIIGLMTGASRYSLNNPIFKKIRVHDAIQGRTT